MGLNWASAYYDSHDAFAHGLPPNFLPSCFCIVSRYLVSRVLRRSAQPGVGSRIQRGPDKMMAIFPTITSSICDDWTRKVHHPWKLPDICESVDALVLFCDFAVMNTDIPKLDTVDANWALLTFCRIAGGHTPWLQRHKWVSASIWPCYTWFVDWWRVVIWPDVSDAWPALAKCTSRSSVYSM